MNAQRLDEDDLAWDFIRLAMSSKANLCVTPMPGFTEPGWKGENQCTVYTWRKLDLENGEGTV